MSNLQPSLSSSSPLARMTRQIRALAGRLAVKASPDWRRVLEASARPYEHIYPDLSKYADQARIFTQSSWVYVAVDFCATAGALVNLNVLRTASGAAPKREALLDHPLERLLRRPNAWQSQYEFMYETLGCLELTGNAFWFLSGPAGGAPTEIMILRPDRVRILAGEHSANRVQGYVYTVNSVDVPLTTEEVVHFRLYNPQDDYYGLSRLEAARLAIQTDLGMQQWNRNYFSQDRGVPAGIVNIRNMITDTEFERIQAEWRTTYGGTQRRTAFIRGGDVTWQDISVTHKDMDFSAGRQFNKEEIFEIYRIPVGLMDKNATEANALAAQELFTTLRIWPMMVSLAQKITVALAPFFGPDLIVEPEDIRKQDATAELREMQAFAPYLTINEVRARYLNLP
ncbi:MAG TPA: phage portal protein, partial [Aggregatilineales bacterium]|nr:phage portal protein [Aggregatilineales bacterium]